MHVIHCLKHLSHFIISGKLYIDELKLEGRREFERGPGSEGPSSDFKPVLSALDFLQQKIKIVSPNTKQGRF